MGGKPFKHGACHHRGATRLFWVWSAMRSRCRNPNNKSYHNYGGRGISVCAEWDDFRAFQSWAQGAGYVEGLSIDRIDNDGNYCPANCQWASPAEQSRNTRRTRPVVRSDGHRFSCAAVAADESGCPRTSVTAVCQGRQKTAGGFSWSYLLAQEAYRPTEEPQR